MHITGFSSAGEDPLPLFMDKTQEKALAERMKEKYDTHRGACMDWTSQALTMIPSDL
jgi:hypothetical protein